MRIESMEQAKTNPDKKNTNLIWVISTLVIIIILLVATILLDRICCAERIVKYMNYTSTLLSIVLSIFAILFSYHSSMKLDQQISSINVAVEVIKATNNQIGQSNQTLVSTLFAMHEKLGHLEASQPGKNDNSSAPLAPTNVSNVPPKG